MSKLRTRLKTVKGLGSAKSGSKHWLMQRVTAAALVLLVSWLVISFLCLVPADYSKAAAWVNNPFHAIALLLLIPVAFYHAALGIQVVIEDYVHSEFIKICAIIKIRLIFFVVAVSAIFSIFYINFKI